ncbi:tRNA (guanine-N1)-methyltransferase, partial [Fannyhessea vaginae]
SGNHEAIKTWKRMNALERTARWRPDLLSRATLTDKEYDFVQNLTSYRKEM